MSLPWVQQALRQRLGFSPYPATLNVRLDSEEEMDRWRDVKRQTKAIDIPPPDASFCRARCFRVEIEGKQIGAVVLPEVEGYPPNKLEVIAPVRIKDQLNVKDGDTITIEFKV